jgi:hypothetical protein
MATGAALAPPSQPRFGLGIGSGRKRKGPCEFLARAFQLVDMIDSSRLQNDFTRHLQISVLPVFDVVIASGFRKVSKPHFQREYKFSRWTHISRRECVARCSFIHDSMQCQTA